MLTLNKLKSGPNPSSNSFDKITDLHNNRTIKGATKINHGKRSIYEPEIMKTVLLHSWGRQRACNKRLPICQGNPRQDQISTKPTTLAATSFARSQSYHTNLLVRVALLPHLRQLEFHIGAPIHRGSAYYPNIPLAWQITQ